MLIGDYSTICRKNLGHCGCSECAERRERLRMKRSRARWYALLLEDYYYQLRKNPEKHQVVLDQSSQFIGELQDLIDNRAAPVHYGAHAKSISTGVVAADS